MNLVKPQEAADKLGVCRTTVMRMMRDGRLSQYKLGYRTVRVDADELEMFRAAYEKREGGHEECHENQKPTG